MNFIYQISFIIFLLIIIKLIAWIILLICSYFGRKIGIGPKFSSENGEYAVINGATGLLGKEFAYEFASMGYNLVLISKNSQRVNKLEQKLRKKCPLMKNVMIVEANFTKMDCYQSIKSKLDSIELITVLVNCVGYSIEPQKFHEIPTEVKQQMILVNVMAPTMLMDMLLPRFVKQNQGIIINVGSQSGDFRFPFYSMFSATKSYVHTLTEICNSESAQGNVYIQNLKPCFVSSGSASKKNEIRASFFKAPANHVSYTSLMTLGTESSTYGHIKHRFSGLLLDILVFIFGHRIVTEFSKWFMNIFVKLNKNERSDTTLASATMDSTTPKTSLGKDRTISLTPPTVPPTFKSSQPPFQNGMSERSSEGKTLTDHIHIQVELPPKDKQQQKEPQPKVVMVKADGPVSQLPKLFINNEELNLKGKTNNVPLKIKSQLSDSVNGKQQLSKPKSVIISDLDNKSQIPKIVTSSQAQASKSQIPKIVTSSQAQASKSQIPKSISSSQAQASKSQIPKSISSSQAQASKSQIPKSISSSQAQASKSQIPKSISSSQAQASKSQMPKSVGSSQAQASKSQMPKSVGSSQQQSSKSQIPESVGSSQQQSSKSQMPKSVGSSQQQSSKSQMPKSVGSSLLQKSGKSQIPESTIQNLKKSGKIQDSVDSKNGVTKTSLNVKSLVEKSSNFKKDNSIEKSNKPMLSDEKSKSVSRSKSSKK